MIARTRILLAIMLTILSIFVGRLIYLQLAQAEAFDRLSVANFLEERRISPLRGRILARDGTIIADSRVAYDLMYLGGDLYHSTRLGALLDIQIVSSEPDPTLFEDRRQGIVLAWNIEDPLVAAVEELVAGQENLYLRKRIERVYPTNLAAQVIGYTTAADPERFPGYVNEELVGVMGIEAGLEANLFGTPGLRRVELNNRRSILRTQVVLPAVPGADITLTIDPTLQRIAEDVLIGALNYINSDRELVGLPFVDTVRGALIALDPRSGEILAMASSPSFDQNLFTKRPIESQTIDPVLRDKENVPLSNRAVQAYAPASTFKVVAGSALLEHGYVGPNTVFPCSPRLLLGGRTWENWAAYHKGGYTVREALADSCNTYFWHAAASTPEVLNGWGPFIEDLVDRAYQLGFGKPVGLGLDEEKAGRIPDRVWADQNYEYGWVPGFTLNTMIGQGDLLATPIQVVQMMATIAMDGWNVTPQLVFKVGERRIPAEAKVIPGRYWGTLQEGMRMMFTDYPARDLMGPKVFPISVAGKTGTAETSKGSDYTHAWFTGYGPIDDPDLALVVFIEHGGSGSRVAVPVARDFMTSYWGIEEVQSQ